MPAPNYSIGCEMKIFSLIPKILSSFTLKPEMKKAEPIGLGTKNSNTVHGTRTVLPPVPFLLESILSWTTVLYGYSTVMSKRYAKIKIFLINLERRSSKEECYGS
jgi:hypothetical protein